MRASYLFLATLILAAAPAYSFADIEVLGPRCLGDGQFSFMAQNRQKDPVSLADTRIVMSHRELGTFPVQGTWSRESIFLQSTITQDAVFTSTTGNLNLSGAYDGAIFFNGCKNPPCMEVFQLRQCPAFTYSCDVSDIKIQQCFVRGDELWVRFTGLNAGQHERLDPLENIVVSMESTSRTLKDASFIGGMSVVQDGEDLYTMKVPRQDGERFFNVELKVRRCKDEPDPDPALCVMGLTPLVERKLNESISRENATVANITPAAPPAEPADDPIRIKRVTTPEPEPAEPVEEPADRPSPRKERSIPPAETGPSMMTLIMTGVFLVWLLGIMVVIVLLFRDRRPY